jgi:hypothetical protein
VFRTYQGPNSESDHPRQFISSARKCSLPPRSFLPGNEPSRDVLPTEASLQESDSRALRAFFYDYCVISGNTRLSPGFLARIEPLLQGLGPDSNLAKGCRAVACATHGQALRRPLFVHRAEKVHQGLLEALAQSIGKSSRTNRDESNLVVMLLGWYQVFEAPFATSLPSF